MNPQYKVLVAAGSDTLTTAMNNYANEGWITEGELQVIRYLDKNDKDIFQYCQKMVLYPETEEVING